MTATPDELDDRLTSPTFIEDRYETYRALRENDPVHWSPRWGVWVLTRYDDILATLREPDTFSNAGRFATFVEGLPPDAQEDAMTISRHNASGMLQSDPPDHTRLRSLVRQAFTPRVVEALRPRVVSLVDEYLDSVDPSGFDLIREFALRLPITVISDLMGLPRTDADRFVVLANEVGSLQATGRAVVENAHRAATAIREIEEHFDQVCRERRRQPGEDLISRMLEAREEGDRMTQDELINMCVNFLFAGHQTTEHLIGNAALLLLDRPSVRTGLDLDPGVWDTAIEECLRYESPIQRGWRRVSRDTEVRGRVVREGQLVYLMLGAANRDPDVFPSPDAFDVRRHPNRHMAFGYGIHFCVGAPLARIEAPIALRRLFARFPDLRLAERPTWQSSIHLRGRDRIEVVA